MSQKYIHCSWDILEPGSLIPRIPKSRVIGPNISEDDSTPRICVADTVQRALMAMPGTGKVIKIMQKYKVPVIIHAYYLEQDWKSIRRPRKNEAPSESSRTPTTGCFLRAASALPAGLGW